MLDGNNLASSKSWRLFCLIIFCKTSTYFSPVSAYWSRNFDKIILSEYLNKYAETGDQYVDVLKKIINQNNLKDFDDAKLLPSSIELESLI